jgi:hypothetical protein
METKNAGTFFYRWSRVIADVKFEPTALRWRHKKRGSTYELVGEAQVQAPDSAPLTDYELVAVYRGDDGKLWVRRVSEFHDRFEPIPR